jgi:hypothetical protein
MIPEREAQRAQALDIAITRLLAGRDEPLPPQAVVPDVSLAAALIEVSARIAPEADFAAALEAQLLPLADSAVPPSGTGNGPGNTRLPGNVPSGNGRFHLRLRGRRLSWRQWLPLAAMVLLTIVLLVPSARANMLTIIRLGAVRIGLASGAPATLPATTPLPKGSPTPTPLASPLDLAGATTLAQAQQQVPFPIRLPAYPPSLGPPQHVFLQNLGGPLVALVWVDPAQPRSVRLALFEMTNGLSVYKSDVPVVAETTVHGQDALWTAGPYAVQVVENGQVVNDTRRLVTGHVLIWTEGDITYRLETDRPLDDAVRIAESLQ